jgi:NAD(P)-dependent dehydrogenase (short-subunit alcohol dehydrogenase family)
MNKSSRDGRAIDFGPICARIPAEAAAAEIAAAGGRVIAVQADLADADAVARMVARTEAELGPVSILVNNAGVSSPAILESYDPAAMTRLRRVNVDGVIHAIRAVAPGMQERGYGRIVTSPPMRRSARRCPARRSMRRPKRRC